MTARAAQAAAWIFVWAVGTVTVVLLLWPVLTDFLSFWSAARLALGGVPEAAYATQPHQSGMDAVISVGGRMPFLYPPPFLLLVLPLGLIPYSPAAALWVAATFLALVVAARRSIQLAFPPVLYNASLAQTGFLTAALFVAGNSALARRPFVGGMLLGGLALKPQLAVLVPVALAAGREWRALAGAAASVALLSLASLAAFGSDAWLAWLGQIAAYGGIAAEGLPGWHKLASVYAALRLAGVPTPLAGVIHAAVAAAAAAAVWSVWRRSAERERKIAVLAAASLLVSPYLFQYDLVMLAPAFAWAAGRPDYRPWLVLMWLVLLAAVIRLWGVEAIPNLTPLATIGALLLCLMPSRRSLREAAPA